MMIMGIFCDAGDFDRIIVPGDVAKKVAALRTVVAKTTADVTTGAQVRSRVDTGTMRAGWQGTVSDGGDAIYGDVSNSVDYTIHNEFGTWKMSAQPMAIPSLDEHAPGFVAAVEQVMGSL